MERVQKMCLRQIISSPWYVRNDDIRRDLKIAEVPEEITCLTDKLVRNAKNESMLTPLQPYQYVMSQYGEDRRGNVSQISSEQIQCFILCSKCFFHNDGTSCLLNSIINTCIYLLSSRQIVNNNTVEFKKNKQLQAHKTIAYRFS